MSKNKNKQNYENKSERKKGYKQKSVFIIYNNIIIMKNIEISKPKKLQNWTHIIWNHKQVKEI